MYGEDIKKMERKKAKLPAYLLLLASLLAPSLKVKAQEIRDKNESSKRIEAAIGWRDKHAYSGRRFGPWMLVGQVNGSANINLPYIGSAGLEGFVWGGYYAGKKSGELDVGVELKKELSKYLILGLEGAIYAIPVNGNSHSHKNISATFRIPVSENFGISGSKDLRDLLHYALSASYTLSLSKNVTLKNRIEWWDSYTFGKHLTLAEVLSYGPVYVTFKLMRAFEYIEGDPKHHKTIPMIEVGLRYQLK